MEDCGGLKQLIVVEELKRDVSKLEFIWVNNRLQTAMYADEFSLTQNLSM